MIDCDDVLEFLERASPCDILQILDGLIDPVSNYIGTAKGIEETRHEVLLQVLEDEKVTV